MTRTTYAHLVAHPAPRPRGRGGVTLIELLVVIAIIGVLLALTTAALQKASEGQNVKASENQVFKLQQALDMEYERILAKCAQDATKDGIPPEVVAFCDGNSARAKAVWTAYQLRIHFPDTFAEATATLPLGTSGVVLKPLSVFAEVQGLPTTGNQPHEESGALLYIILAKKSASGGGAMATSADDLTQAQRKKVTFGARELETFSDAWKNSVGFRRWDQSDEVQVKPYVDPRLAAGANKDALDPQNLVYGWSDPTKKAAMNQAPPFSLLFNGRNRTAAVYSVGKDKTISPADDILGYRLRKQGQSGVAAP